jgi:hypothetical protein
MRLLAVLITLISFHHNSFSQYNPSSNIHSELIDSTAVKISWDFQEGVYYYRIRRKEVDTSSWVMTNNPTNIIESLTERE